MNSEEARAEFILTMEDACIESCEHNSQDFAEHNITIAADVYALAVHVDACHLRDSPFLRDAGDWTKCGDGWYCDKGKEIEARR